MLLSLHTPAHPPPAPLLDLVSRPGKHGRASARGLLVDGAGGEQTRPLAALADGDKLHIAAPGDASVVAQLDPAALVQRLARLGLSTEVRLAQIHLISDDAGMGDEASFARSFADALTRQGFHVDEVKAPRGRVQWDPHGKVQILTAGATDYRPSESALNYYVGPRVHANHR